MTVDARTRAYAKAHGSSQTQAEQRLWCHLRAHRFMGVTSRREKPIGPRIVDFVAVELALIIELDGGQHAAQETADAARTAVLEHEGFKVLRLWNDEVLARTDVVLEQIRMAVASSETLSPNPSPASGRGEIKVRN